MPDETDQEWGTEDPIFEIDADTLATIGGLTRIVDGVGWYRAVGTPLDTDTYADTKAYLAALGFPDLRVVALVDGEEILQILEERTWGGTWSDTEEQVRAALAEEALGQLDAEVIQAATQHLGGHAHAAALAAAKGIPALQLPRLLSADPDDAGPDEKAAEDARGTICQALLMALSGAGAEHPLALKFRLFEAGRWPLGAVGGSFYVF